MHALPLSICILILAASSALAQSKQEGEQISDVASRSKLFSANFDGDAKATLAQGKGVLHTAESTKRLDSQPSNRIDSVSIEPGAGKSGDALRFAAKTKQLVYYPGNEVGYRKQNWSGTVSLWLKLNPNKDLQPGFCDPIQITARAWNDGALFVDFDKDLPRDFRLGVFPDYASWNPDDIKWDDVPVEQRPMVVVKNPPFAADRWTHVCFTWHNINAADGSPARAELYLNGEFQGAIERPMQFTWDEPDIAMMLGLSYIGLIDDLNVWSVALTAEQIKKVSGTLNQDGPTRAPHVR